VRETEKQFDSAEHRELRLKAADDYQALLDYVTAWQAEEVAKLKLEPSSFSSFRYDFRYGFKTNLITWLIFLI
jgi:hypothetical protein